VRQPSTGTVEVAIKATERAFGVALSGEQSAAVDVVTSSARIAGLVGRAGSGKGVVIHAASNAYRGDGWQVLACATQGARAQGLASQTSGLAMTIDQLMHRTSCDRIAVDTRTVVFVDEAGMVDTFRMAQLVHLVERTGCSIRLVGDPAQLSAIGPGGLLPSILATRAVPVAELAEIHRTQHQWIRDAQNYVRAGDSMRALELMAQHDALHMENTQAEARIRMVADWNRWRHDYEIGDTLMVVHTTNEDVDRVNTLAQAYRAAAGELSDASVKSPDRDYQLHEGDRVMLRERAYYLDDPAEARVENGTRGTILAVDTTANSVDVLLDEPGHDQQRTVTFELDRCDALRLDYASHVYPAQGDTRSRTAELTGGPSVNRENAYVGGTRLRDRHDLYTSREALGTDGDDTARWNRLADQMNESRAQTPSVAYREERARDIAVKPPHPVLDREVAHLDRIEHDLRAAKQHHEQLQREFPSHEQRTLTRFETSRDEMLDTGRRADEQVQRHERELAQLRPWQRDRINTARREIEQWTERRDQAYQRSDEWGDAAERVRQGERSPERWNREHGADLAARQQRVDDLTRQRDAQRERVVERAIEAPPRYLTRVLGERPDAPAQRAAWDQAVRSVETYRAKHDVHERHTALGREPSGGTERWDFKRAAEHIDDARRTIGHARDAHAIAHHRDGHGRGIGRQIGGHGR
jgi:hypothetical protein